MGVRACVLVILSIVQHKRHNKPNEVAFFTSYRSWVYIFHAPFSNVAHCTVRTINTIPNATENIRLVRSIKYVCAFRSNALHILVWIMNEFKIHLTFVANRKYAKLFDTTISITMKTFINKLKYPLMVFRRKCKKKNKCINSKYINTCLIMLRLALVKWTNLRSFGTKLNGKWRMACVQHIKLYPTRDLIDKIPCN